MATKSEILSAVDQVKEHLALNRAQDAIKLMAQVSVAIIENLTDEALIVSKGYEEDLKSLVAAGVINDSTSHNLETLIVSGVQANNGVDVPREYVDKAYDVLADEIDIIYNKNENKVNDVIEASSTTPLNQDINNENFNFGGVNGQNEADEPVFLTPDGDVDFRAKERNRKISLARSLVKNKRKISKLIALLVPVILIIVLAIIIKGCVSSAADRAGYKKPAHVIETVESVTEVIETTAPIPYWSGVFMVTGNRVWIRDQANTTSSKKLEGKDKGDLVTVVGEYDADWAIIAYEGTEAFMSKTYLIKQEGETAASTPETVENTDTNEDTNQ